MTNFLSQFSSLKQFSIVLIVDIKSNLQREILQLSEEKKNELKNNKKILFKE